MMAPTEFSDDRWCMACGEENPQGLHLKFRFEGDDCVCDFLPKRVHQGWAGVVHGGILATLLDEVINQALCLTVGPVVTAQLNVRYRKPAPTGESLRVSARVTGGRGKLHEAEAEVTLADGTILASGTAKLMEVEGNLGTAQ